jgi:Spy/CpxP family protein refolding chaperone
MRILASALLVVQPLILAGLLAAAPLHAVDPKGIKAGGPGGPGAKAPVRGGLKDNTALWWNDPGMTKILSLTDEQRKKMNDTLAAYRKSVPTDRRPDAFHETLVQGNWKQARSENEKVASVAQMSVHMRGKLKIDVLSSLSKEQLALLVDRYPRLIYKPWTRAMRGSSPR